MKLIFLILLAEKHLATLYQGAAINEREGENCLNTWKTTAKTDFLIHEIREGGDPEIFCQNEIFSSEYFSCRHLEPYLHLIKPSATPGSVDEAHIVDRSLRNSLRVFRFPRMPDYFSCSQLK